MQLIWVAGPADKVVTLSITTRTVLTALAAVSSFLVLLGFLFHLIGLRVAVEYVPELAQRIRAIVDRDPDSVPESAFHLNRYFVFLGGRIRDRKSVG
jgi:hypothetical protein